MLGDMAGRIRGVLVTVWGCYILVLPSLCMADCPINDNPGCQCEIGSRYVINCKGLGLTDVPMFTESSFPWDEVTLADNNIQTIPDDTFGELRFSKLDLANNPVSTIEPRAFDGTPVQHLKHLILHMNSVESFPKDELSYLQNLELLEMEGLQTPQLPQGALENLVKLQELHLTNCGLVSLDSTVLTGQTDSLETLGLELNSLSAVPTEALNELWNLRSLMLAGNQLTDIQNAAFGSANLEQLDLSHNPLDTIENGAFFGLEDSLQNLTLRSCNLRDDDMTQISGLRSLRELDIGHNSVANIPNDYFQDMPSLESFVVLSNQIHSLGREMFQHLSGLQHLDLSHNQINSVDPESFSPLDSLQTLILEVNPSLSNNLPINVFEPVKDTLQVLNLICTGFSSGHWDVIQDMENLMTLSLTGNTIDSIVDFAFNKMTRMTSLRLDENSLSEVTQRGFHGMQNSLVSSDLSDNNLETLDECVFYNFRNVDPYLLGLHGNPLHCDCHMKWLLVWLKEDPEFDFKKYGLNWVCASPPEHAGEMLWDLTEEEFQCEDGTTPGPCEDLSPPPTPPPGTGGPTGMPLNLKMNITGATSTTINISWSINDLVTVEGFEVEYSIVDDDLSHTRRYESWVRYALLTDLQQGTTYSICLEALIDSMADLPESRLCDEFTTEPDPDANRPGSNDYTLEIALGCTFGAIGLGLIIFLVLFFIRQNAKDKGADLPKSQGAMPHANQQSIRFSKPKKNPINLENIHIPPPGGATGGPSTSELQNKDNFAFEDKLEGFSKEEQNRILEMYRQGGGGSTLSVISNASSGRYVPDLPPRQQGMSSYHGYRNPRTPTDDPDKHIYCEIPDYGGTYDEIRDDTIV